MTALQRLKEVCEAATPRKWNATVLGDPFNWGVDAYSSDGDYLCNIIKCSLPEANARFIATARTALPILVELCEKLELWEELADYMSDFIGFELFLGPPSNREDHLRDLNKRYKEAAAAVEAARARLESILTAHQPKGGGEE